MALMAALSGVAKQGQSHWKLSQPITKSANW